MLHSAGVAQVLKLTELEELPSPEFQLEQTLVVFFELPTDQVVGVLADFTMNPLKDSDFHRLYCV